MRFEAKLPRPPDWRARTSGLVAVFTLLATLLSTSVYGTEVTRWQRLPIAVALHVGQERILFLDRPMRIAVPTVIAEHLRVQSADGAIYLRASEAFEATRVELQDADNGTLVLLDVTATAAPPEATLEPMRIVLAKPSSQASVDSESQNDPSDTQNDAPAGVTTTPSAVLLIRYAAQSLYAPLRTVEPVAGLIPTPVHPTLDLSTLLPSLPVTLSVLGAWRLQDQWVTAIRITHLAPNWMMLDPRLLQGDFVAASFQHRQLGPQGQSTDTTVLYLVTRGHGLAESLLPAVSPVDATANLAVPPPADVPHEE